MISIKCIGETFNPADLEITIEKSKENTYKISYNFTNDYGMKDCGESIIDYKSIFCFMEEVYKKASPKFRPLIPKNLSKEETQIFIDKYYK